MSLSCWAGLALKQGFSSWCSQSASSSCCPGCSERVWKKSFVLGRGECTLPSSRFLPGSGPHIASFPCSLVPWTLDSVVFFFLCPFSFCLMRWVVAECLIDAWYVQLVFIFLRKAFAQWRIANGNQGGISGNPGSSPSSSVPHPSRRKHLLGP